MNGVLVIDKPEGFTSHDVVNKVRRILKTKSVGHTGTLDPFATGVLVILVGKATRLAQFLDKAEKEYLAKIRFGFETTTGDLTGEAKESQISEFQISDEEIENALSKFRGEIWQKPPMYSAKKIQGKKLYELARQGKEIERQPVKINIAELETAEPKTKDQRPKTDFLQIRVVCTAGTYVRVLAEDIGRELGVGGHLTELRRTRAGSFDLRQAVSLDGLQNLANENQVEKVLISPADALAHLPLVKLTAQEAQRTLNGMKIRIDNPELEENQFVRMCDEQGNLVAVGVFSEQMLQPRIVLTTAEDVQS